MKKRRLITSIAAAAFAAFYPQLSHSGEKGDFSVSFSKSSGTYWYSNFSNDFGNVSGYSNTEKGRTSYSDYSLQTILQAGQLSSGGLITQTNLQDSDEYILEYKVKFSSSFEWVKGGKLPGLSGGAGYTGCDDPTGGDGWSVRMMWRENGRLIPYVYADDRPSGENCGYDYDTTIGYLSKNTWHRIKIHVRMNTGSSNNGALKVYLDNMSSPILEVYNVRYVTQDWARYVTKFRMDVFYGGSSNDWKPSGSNTIYFDDFRFDKR